MGRYDFHIQHNFRCATSYIPSTVEDEYRREWGMAADGWMAVAEALESASWAMEDDAEHALTVQLIGAAHYLRGECLIRTYS